MFGKIFFDKRSNTIFLVFICHCDPDYSGEAILIFQAEKITSSSRPFGIPRNDINLKINLIK